MRAIPTRTATPPAGPWNGTIAFTPNAFRTVAEDRPRTADPPTERGPEDAPADREEPDAPAEVAPRSAPSPRPRLSGDRKRLGGLALLLTAALLSAVVYGRSAPAQNPAPPREPWPEAGRAAPVDEPPRELRKPLAPKALARVEGIAAAGQVVTLRGEESRGGDLRFRWVQTQGPAAILESPEGPSTRLTIPDGAGPLGFLLVVSNAEGSDTATLTVPLDPRGRPHAASRVVADAGDDQIALVNRQVTLNGIRSEPRERIAYRWVQVGGPPVRLKIEEGPFYSFVPALPGVYRFALVVGIEGEISEPDLVTVTVGASTPRGAAAPAEVAPPTPESAPAAEPTSELARSALASIQGGGEHAEELASAFEAASERVDLYRTYTEAYSELSRRLDRVVPAHPAHRAVWNERLFLPLTGRIIDAMLSEGLDLRQVEGQNAPLTAAQRAQLSDVFRSISEGFRAVPHVPNGVGPGPRPEGLDPADRPISNEGDSR